MTWNSAECWEGEADLRYRHTLVIARVVMVAPGVAAVEAVKAAAAATAAVTARAALVEA